MHWTDRLHAAVLALADLVNRSDLDARLLADSGIKLDRALFPLLSRISMAGEISTVALANLIGRDHSTVSRQASKLEELGLVERVPSSSDARMRHLVPSDAGKALIRKVRDVRRKMLERHFQAWPEHDRDTLVTLLERMVGRN
jgi:DNA-binding MarR family transcriptional regulator